MVDKRLDSGAESRLVMSENAFRLAHVRAFDGFRGVAILLVMGYHAGFSFLPGGFLGVDVFFVLSGFLITALLMEEWERTESINLANFYARRALRLLPALVTLLGVMLLFLRLFVPPQIALWKIAMIVLLYVANWASALQLAYLHVLVPTWSLAIEEQFYLLWPPLLVLLLVLKVRREWIIGLVVVGIEVAAGLRVLLWEPSRAGVARVAFGLDTRMDALLLGCLVGLLAAWNLLPRRRWLVVATKLAPAPATAILLVLLYRARDNSSYVFHGAGLLASACVATMLVAILVARPGLALLVLEHPTLAGIGRISYGLYLWHFPIFFGLLSGPRVARLGLAADEAMLARFAVTFVVAALSYHFIELPILRLKRHFRGAAHRPAPAAPSGWKAGAAPTA